MADPGRLAAFRRAAEELHPDDPARAALLTEMEGRFLDSQFSTDPDQDFQLLTGLFGDRSISDLREWAALRSRDAAPLMLGPLGELERGEAPAPMAAVTRQASPDIEYVRAIHNERVKLNATLFNTLSGWAFGAGGVGIAATSLLGSAPHRWLVTAGILASGLLFGGLLKWLANREVGKLR